MDGFLPTNAILMARRGKAPAPAVDVFFVGEPDADASALQLLEKMIEAMGLKRESVALVSVNAPDLAARLSTACPKIIVALGERAMRQLLQSSESISTLRGNFQDCDGVKLMPTYHPGQLLTQPELKREAWEDLKKVARELGLELPIRKGSAT